MKFRNNLPFSKEIKNTDIADYLSSPGFEPSRVPVNDYWYISPFRDKRTASFKVNRSKNRRYDFGDGKGGNLVDLSILSRRCRLADFLKKMKSSFSFRQQKAQALNEDNDIKKIKIIGAKEISSLMLLRCLHTRRIPVDLAIKYCRQIDYQLYGKTCYTIGFKNNAGDYKLRYEFFKLSSVSKYVSYVSNFNTKNSIGSGWLKTGILPTNVRSNQFKIDVLNHALNATVRKEIYVQGKPAKQTKFIAVFERFCDFLRWQSLHQNQQHLLTNFPILNSVSFFERCLILMDKHERIYLYMDYNSAERKCVEQVLKRHKSSLHKAHKYLNNRLMHFGKLMKKQSLKQSNRLGLQ